MKKYNVDFHIHGPYAGGTSKNMSVENNSKMGYLKGLDIVPIGDLLHKKWYEEVFSKLIYEDETYFYEFKLNKETKRTYFVLSTEVQLKDRSHHILIFPNKESVLEFRDKIKPFAKSLDGSMDGRPWLMLNTEQFAKIASELNLLFGPAHAFTPYFGVYAHFKSLKEAYGEYFDNVAFLELGLSADSYLANNIEELKDIVFLSNSDAHSYWPNKLGREFNQLYINKPSFYEFEKVFRNKDGRKITLNVGLDPKEGKYHITACNKCYKAYSYNDAQSLNWRCDCGGQIKKGVKDLIMELSNFKTLSYNRPKYLHILPLSEIIAMAYKLKNVFSAKVQNKWQELVGLYDNEINVLLNVSESELLNYDPLLAKYIISFRNGYVVYKPGGGGKYGEPIICFSKEEKEQVEKEINNNNLYKKEGRQKNLFDSYNSS